MAFQSKMQSLAPRRQTFQRKIKLFSNGFSCPSAFPNGEITIYPWDNAIDEFISERVKKGNPDKLMFDLLKEVCNLNGCPPEQFVLSEVNLVLLISRSIRYDSIVEFSCVCPNCNAVQGEKIKVPEQLGKSGEKKDGYCGYDEIELPKCKDKVAIRPLLIRDDETISTRDDLSKHLFSNRTAYVLFPVVTINDGKPDSPTDLVTWYNALHPIDAAHLEEKENELTPHLDTNVRVQCNKCTRQFIHTLDFTRDFFRTSLQ